MENLGNKQRLSQTLTYIKEIVTPACFRVSPTTNLTENKGGKIAASALQMQTDRTDGHFKAFEATAADKTWLNTSLCGMLSDPCERQLMRPIALCSGNVLAKVATLLGSLVDGDVTGPAVLSEAELRFAVADPIIETVCNCWGYQVTKT